MWISRTIQRRVSLLRCVGRNLAISLDEQSVHRSSHELSQDELKAKYASKYDKKHRAARVVSKTNSTKSAKRRASHVLGVEMVEGIQGGSYPRLTRQARKTADPVAQLYWEGVCFFTARASAAEKDREISHGRRRQLLRQSRAKASKRQSSTLALMSWRCSAAKLCSDALSVDDMHAAGNWAKCVHDLPGEYDLNAIIETLRKVRKTFENPDIYLPNNVIRAGRSSFDMCIHILTRVCQVATQLPLIDVHPDKRFQARSEDRLSQLVSFLPLPARTSVLTLLLAVSTTSTDMWQVWEDAVLPIIHDETLPSEVKHRALDSFTRRAHSVDLPLEQSERDELIALVDDDEVMRRIEHNDVRAALRDALKANDADVAYPMNFQTGDAFNLPTEVEETQEELESELAQEDEFNDSDEQEDVVSENVSDEDEDDEEYDEEYDDDVEIDVTRHASPEAFFAPPPEFLSDDTDTVSESESSHAEAKVHPE
ncbi:MAG: hypothetical protein MHM6MM_006553 [Cercozoa sp. M6MM]